jgi:hypothetical protein
MICYALINLAIALIGARGLPPAAETARLD